MTHFESQSLRNSQRVAPPHRGHLVAVALFFTAIAIYGSLVPLNYQPLEFQEAVRHFRNIEYLNLGIHSRADWVANILLFIPLGFLWLGSISVDQPRSVGLVTVVPLIAVLALLSLTIEFTQLWFPGRTVSQNDIIAETMGGAIGAALWLVAGQPVIDWLRLFFMETNPPSRRHKLMQIYLLGLCVYSVMPLDLTISVGELYKKFKSGKVVLVPFSYEYHSIWDLLYNVLVDAIVFIPVGALAVKGFFRERPIPRSVSKSIALGALVVAAIELVQLIVFSRTSDVTDLIMCTSGVVIGVWLMHRGSSQQSVEIRLSHSGTLAPGFWKWTGVMLIYMFVLVVIFWAPFEFRFKAVFARPRLENFFAVPFKWMYFGSEFKAITEFLRKSMFFSVLGALCVQVVNCLRVRSTMRCVLLFAAAVGCAIWAFGIELGQIVQPSHTPDFTDVLLCTFGAVVGILIAKRVLQIPHGKPNSEQRTS